MTGIALTVLQFLNQLLTAGIAITAVSLLLYALTFNLRDRVARSFAVILLCVVVVYVGDAISSIASTPTAVELWLRFEWVGIAVLPAAYLQFSDALLATTGRPSRGRRRLATRLVYLISLGFLVTLPFELLVGPLVTDQAPAPHLQRTWLTWVFAIYFCLVLVWAWVNFWRAYQRAVTRSSQRRMRYLLAGSLAPALGSFPFLLFGSGVAEAQPLFFWLVAININFLVTALLVVMAYSVAFFGVAWPDRMVKRRLFKWIVRGPVTASTILALTTLARRMGVWLGTEYSAVVPVVMVGSLLILNYAITLAAPVWERWLFHGGDRANMSLLQKLEERLLTSGDLRQLLEAILAAVCDHLQASRAFVVCLDRDGALEMVVSVGDGEDSPELLPAELVQLATQQAQASSLFAWGKYWLVPLHPQEDPEDGLLGLLGVETGGAQALDSEDQATSSDQTQALQRLAQRAAQALEDRRRQQEAIGLLAVLTPQMEQLQRLRAETRYDGAYLLASPDEALESSDLSRWVKDALTHYWGGPKLTESPLLGLRVVQRAMDEHEENPANALRAILRQAVDQVRPEGERRFTGEWILYNILEMKFMEGRKVREIAMRLAMSEADLYRKQRVAIESVAGAILEMEKKAMQTEADSPVDQ